MLVNDPALSTEQKNKVYAAYSREMIVLSFGQATDIYWHNGHSSSVNEQQYLQMCSYKTASLARFAIKLGAILGNASEKQEEAFADFATSIGVAFQIQDDILNIKPEKGWGKEVGDDISEGKRTLIVIRALPQLNEVKKKRLIAILDKPDNEKNEIKEAISILNETDAVQYSSNFAKKLVMDSWKNLEPLLEESPAKERLKQFANFLVEREI